MNKITNFMFFFNYSPGTSTLYENITTILGVLAIFIFFVLAHYARIYNDLYMLIIINANFAITEILLFLSNTPKHNDIINLYRGALLLLFCTLFTLLGLYIKFYQIPVTEQPLLFHSWPYVASLFVFVFSPHSVISLSFWSYVDGPLGGVYKKLLNKFLFLKKLDSAFSRPPFWFFLRLFFTFLYIFSTTGARHFSLNFYWYCWAFSICRVWQCWLGPHLTKFVNER